MAIKVGIKQKFFIIINAELTQTNKIWDMVVSLTVNNHNDKNRKNTYNGFAYLKVELYRQKKKKSTIIRSYHKSCL